jgi:7-carboxy-7-deazaguanine synthase
MELLNKTNSLVSKAYEGVYTYSEIFHSIQGEGKHTGRNTVWLRLFGCNLNCSGFGQVNPTDPSSWDLPYLNVDLSTITEVEQLPVFERGCDTSYSWSKRFRHLMRTGTTEEICERLIQKITNQYNPNGLFVNGSRQVDLCFTGGEPLLPHSQHTIEEIINHLIAINNCPSLVTVETNGTQLLEEDFYGRISQWWMDTVDLFLSVSPKLFTVSGERPEKAIRPDVLQQYSEFNGQFKFVVSGSKESWDELDSVLEVLQSNERLKEWPVYIMKVGGTLEGQQGSITGHPLSEQEFVGEVLKRGFHYSPRVHINVWGNVVGS